jgi:DNA-binding NarL/FixJ family response regulator
MTTLISFGVVMDWVGQNKNGAQRLEGDELLHAMGEELITSRILVVDDHPLLRKGFVFTLSSEPDLEVVGEAASGLEALELCQETRPDLVLMDISMPIMDGIEATRGVKERCPKTLVLVLTAHEDDSLMLEAIRAGAVGYLLKGSSPRSLVASVRDALGGESPMDSRMAGRLLRRLTEEESSPHALTPLAAAEGEARNKAVGPPLSPRELEVLGRVVIGKTNRLIAQELHMSLSTVKRHLERAGSKLGVSDRTQAVVRAIELGLLPGRREECRAHSSLTVLR